jgi:LNR domain
MMKVNVVWFVTIVSLNLDVVVRSNNMAVASSSPLDDYPDCQVDVSSIPWFARYPGDGFCAPQLNIPECGFDGGDCDALNDQYPDCVPLYNTSSIFAGLYWRWISLVNDSVCDSFLNTEGCEYDGGDCLEFHELYPNCDVPYPTWVGDVSDPMIVSPTKRSPWNTVHRTLALKVSLILVIIVDMF